MSDYKKAAQAALQLLERVELKGTEVQAYIAANNLVGGIAQGRLEVVAAGENMELGAIPEPNGEA